MISFLTSVLLSNVLCICYFLNYIKLPIIEVKDFVVLWNLLQYLVLMLMTLEFVVFPLKNGSWPLYNCLWLKLVWSTNFQRIIKPKFYSSYLFQHFFVPFFFFSSIELLCWLFHFLTEQVLKVTSLLIIARLRRAAECLKGIDPYIAM